MKLLVALLLLLLPALAEAKSDRERAVELVQRAAELYKNGKLVEAAALFVEAFELSKQPTQLRNAAKAYADAGRIDDALEVWRRLASEKKISAAERAEAEAQIALIEEKRRAAAAEAALEKERAKAEAARLEAAKAEAARAEAAKAEAERVEEAKREAERIERAKLRAAPVPVIVHAPPAPPPAEPSIAPYVTLGIGAASAIAGIAVFAHASSRLSSLDEGLAMRDASGDVEGIGRTEAIAELDGVNTERKVAAGLALGAVIVAGAGIVWMLAGGAE